MTVITGSDAHEELVGTADNDTILGLGGHDTLIGGDGDDTLDGGEGNDVFYGGEGDDTLIAGAGYDILDGGAGSDTYLVGLDGLGMANLFTDTGLSGHDIILATEANTIIALREFHTETGVEEISSGGFEGVTIAGSDESQTLNFSTAVLSGITMINALGGHDFVTGNADANHIDGGDGHDHLEGEDGDDYLYGGAGNDQIFGGNGADHLFAGTGYDTLNGGEDGDTYYVGLGDTGQVNLYNDTGTAGTDRILATEDGTVIGLNGFGPGSGIEIISANAFENVTIAGSDESQTLDFSATALDKITLINALGGHDTVIGNNDSNHIDGGSGHDIIDGGDGRDWLYGGDGNDMIYGGDGRDYLFAGTGYDTLDGGEGSDVYYVGLSDTGQVNTYTDTGTEGRDRIQATEDGTVIGLNGFGPDSGIEVISGRKFANVTIAGNDEAQTLDFSATKISRIAMIEGLGGHDTIIGNDQSNKIDGGTGHDILHGGGGGDWLYGGADNDIIYGGDGRDKLFAGSGHDIIDGGEGSDTYYFDTSSNEGSNDMIDTGTEGRDRAVATEDGTKIGLATVFNADNGIESISGRKFADVSIFGTAVDNEWDFTDVRLSNIDHIDGALGNDVIIGSKGRDTILGSEGDDELFGGRGRDILDGGLDNDLLNGGAGNDILTGGEGLDTFVFDSGSGRDTITDFTAGEDVIDLTSMESIDSFDDLRVRDTDDGALVYLDGGRVLLEGIDADSVTADFFVFG